jgi:rRNA-processing protein FCF1
MLSLLAATGISARRFPDIKTPLSRIIDEELLFQVGHPNIHGNLEGRLGQAEQRLIGLQDLAARLGHICVPDTNALLHYTRFDMIDWKDRLGAPAVRLVIPLAVVDELDNKKYARRAEFRGRARDLLKLIDDYVSAAPPDGYSPMQDGVTVEVLPDEDGHDRAPSNDQEIRERCELLQQITGETVTLVTGDSAVRINASAQGVNVFKLTDDDLLPRYKVQSDLDPSDSSGGLDKQT